MLKGLGQLGDMAKIMKQAQEMQERMSDVQARLERDRGDRRGRGRAGARSPPTPRGR